MLDTHARVLHEIDLRSLWQRRLELREARTHLVGDIGRAIAVRFLDVDADRFLAVVERQRAWLLRRILDRRDLTKANERACDAESCFLIDNATTNATGIGRLWRTRRSK